MKTVCHEHKIINVHGKAISVDTAMIELIEWINSIKHAKTQFCCQGDRLEEARIRRQQGLQIQTPYVVWTAGPVGMKRIITLFDLSRCAETKVELYLGQIRYCTRWPSFIDFIKFTKKADNEFYKVRQKNHQ